MMFTAISIFFFGYLAKVVATWEVAAFLDRAHSGEVFIDGQKVPDSIVMIAALRPPEERIGAHHSHQTNRLEVMVYNGEESLELKLGRDSSRRQEYWVSYNRYWLLRSGEAYRITTSAFDSYK